MRTCQICQLKKPLTDFYTTKSYICKECHSIVTNVSRFKQLIKKEGADYATNILIKEKFLVDIKWNVLAGKTINESCRNQIERYFKNA